MPSDRRIQLHCRLETEEDAGKERVCNLEMQEVATAANGTRPDLLLHTTERYLASAGHAQKGRRFLKSMESLRQTSSSSSTVKPFTLTVKRAKGWIVFKCRYGAGRGDDSPGGISFGRVTVRTMVCAPFSTGHWTSKSALRLYVMPINDTVWLLCQGRLTLLRTNQTPSGGS